MRRDMEILYCQILGKDTSECNKETMVLSAFRTMIELIRSPDEYVKRLGEGRGMDKM